ncbi:glycosyl transferases group 1 [Vibrio harveyi]|nr:glycosyl transferases group 1 [Vibrio harveyi]
MLYSFVGRTLIDKRVPTNNTRAWKIVNPKKRFWDVAEVLSADLNRAGYFNDMFFTRIS